MKNKKNSQATRENVGRKVVSIANVAFRMDGWNETKRVDGYSFLVSLGVRLEMLTKDAEAFTKNPSHKNFNNLRACAIAFADGIREEKLGRVE